MLQVKIRLTILPLTYNTFIYERSSRYLWTQCTSSIKFQQYAFFMYKHDFAVTRNLIYDSATLYVSSISSQLGWVTWGARHQYLCIFWIKPLTPETRFLTSPWCSVVILYYASINDVLLYYCKNFVATSSYHHHHDICSFLTKFSLPGAQAHCLDSSL